MIKRRHICLMLGLVTTAIVLWGCDAREPLASGVNRRHSNIGIVLVGRAQDDPTWPVLRSTAKRFEELYPYVKVRVEAAETASPMAQQSILEGLLKKNDNAVCVDPVDPLAVQSTVNRLVSTGHPVVTMGRDIPSSSRAVYCGPSESELGKAAASACLDALAGRSKTVILLHAGDDNELYRVRYYAFKDALPEVGLIRLFKEVNCRGNALDAAREVRQQSRKYPRVGCWVFLDDWPLRSIRPKERILPLGCGLVLCNGSPNYFDRMRRGDIQAFVAFDYYNVVQDSLRTACRLAQPKTPERSTIIATPLEIITAHELNDYARRWRTWQRGQPSP